MSVVCEILDCARSSYYHWPEAPEVCLASDMRRNSMGLLIVVKSSQESRRNGEVNASAITSPHFTTHRRGFYPHSIHVWLPKGLTD